jgi:catalase (peroxidase I)
VPLPNPEGSCGELQRVFIDNMELSWEETAALSGAHTLGRAKFSNSGYNGFWVNPRRQDFFDNEYFVSLAMKGWKPKKSLGGDGNKNVWVRSDQVSTDYETFENEPQMMLNTDLCLLYTNNFNSTLRASDQLECCSWLDRDTVPMGANQSTTACATAKDNEDDSEGSVTESRGWCCGGNAHHLDCNNPAPYGKAASHVLRFAKSDKEWTEAFKKAWAKATENGRDDLIWLIAPEHKQPPAEKSNFLFMIIIVSVPLVLIFVGAGVYQMMSGNKDQPPGPMEQQQYGGGGGGYSSGTDPGPMWYTS